MKNMLNKRLILIAICLSLVIPAFAASWGLPSYLWIKSFSIQDYSRMGDLPRSHAHKSRFVNGIKGNVNSKYSAISASNTDFQDANATVANMVSSDSYEIVFFAGHGGRGGPCLYDRDLVNTDKAFGSWTRWVFWDACLTMNNSFEYQDDRFGGVHGIFGYNSLGYQFHKWTDYIFWTSNHEYSEELWSRFANRWVNDGWGMYDAYKDAVQVEVANEGYSVEIAAFYVKGNIGGQYLDGSNETLANMYNGEMELSQATDGFWKRWTVWGSPSY